MRTEGTVRIDELCLDGLPVRDPEAFGATVARELETLARRDGLNGDLGAPPVTSPPVSLALDRGTDDEGLARLVADAVWRSIGGGR